MFSPLCRTFFLFFFFSDFYEEKKKNAPFLEFTVFPKKKKTENSRKFFVVFAGKRSEKK